MSTETCIAEDVMLALVARQPRQATNLGEVESHLDRCSECRSVLAELVKSSRARVPRASVTRGIARVDPRRPRAAEPVAGEVIGHRFVLEARLGEGAAGAVWSARERLGGEIRAIKLLHSAMPEQVRRLRREAAVLRALHHPNIVSVHDVVETPERGPVLVMERLEGQSLEARLRAEPPMTFAELAPIARGVLAALSAAHARGIAHRDLKPANVFLEAGPAAPAARVLDFGMAKLDAAGWQAAGLTPAITKSGALIGTPLYMAPEQVFGERSVDGRADVWSFGVIVQRALTGQLPVEASTLADLMKRLGAGTVRPFAPKGPVPDALPPLVARLLATAPADRPSLAEIASVFA